MKMGDSCTWGLIKDGFSCVFRVGSVSAHQHLQWNFLGTSMNVCIRASMGCIHENISPIWSDLNAEQDNFNAQPVEQDPESAYLYSESIQVKIRDSDGTEDEPSRHRHTNSSLNTDKHVVMQKVELTAARERQGQRTRVTWTKKPSAVDKYLLTRCNKNSFLAAVNSNHRNMTATSRHWKSALFRQNFSQHGAQHVFFRGKKKNSVAVAVYLICHGNQ